MNQILYTGDKKQKVEINKIVIVFAIIIIIFALFLIGQGIYFLSKKGNRKVIEGNKANAPEVTANAEGSSVEISIKHGIAMEKIFYSWKNGEENEINNVSGKMEVNEKVLLPNEDTTLNIRIIDQNNEEYKVEKEFKYNSNIDVVKPKIQLASITGNVLATIIDNKEISYIEYNWNDEEAVRVKANEDQKTKMEYKIPAKEGKNKLTILAVDASRKYCFRR